MKTLNLFYDTYESPVGILYLVFMKKSLAGVSFRKPHHIPFRQGHAPRGFIKELTDYFGGKDTGFSQTVQFLTGTEFEKKVWNCLKEIPFGETRTYRWVAEKAGNPAATRAAGKALSKNPVPIVLPCHRVIETDGSIGGYSSGINIKRRLLDMEYYSKKKEKGSRPS